MKRILLFIAVFVSFKSFSQGGGDTSSTKLVASLGRLGELYSQIKTG